MSKSKTPIPRIILAGENDYKSFKQIFDRGKHPAFIGRETFGSNAINGGALFYELDQKIIAVSLINPHYGILLALNVVPENRRQGIGEFIVRFLMPNFIRALSTRIEWFEKLGYRKIGSPKKGVLLETQIMAREALFHLAGKLNRVWGNGRDTIDTTAVSPPK